MLGAIALTVASAAALGAADFLGGLAARRVKLSAVTLISLWVATATVAPGCLLTRPPVSPGGVGWAAGSGVLTAVAVPLLYGALASGPMSLVAPISSSSAILPAAVGVARGASVGVVTGVGLALTFFGVLVLSGAAAPPGDEGQRVNRRGLLLALGAAVTIGASVALLQAAASAEGSSGLGAAMVALGVAAIVVTLAAPSASRRAFRAGELSRLAVGSGAASGVGMALLSLASRSPDATTVVAVLSSLYAASTILLARLVLRERLSRSQAGGVVCALVGVAIVSAA